MDSSKSGKRLENNENECPSTSKRRRIPKQVWTLVNEDESPKILEEMGIGMLESDESSSSAASATELIIPQVCDRLSTDENSNEPPCDTESTEYSATDETSNRIKQNCEHERDNATFVDPNQTLIPSNYKISSSNIEIYTDSNSSKTTDRIQKKICCQHTKGRSPLATVACNNNYNNINQNSLEGSNLKKQVFLPDENFFLYRNRIQRQTATIKDPFRRLSDEVILQIFKWLPKKTLIRCSYVCRRFNQLAQDESLWTRLDLGCKTLRGGALGQVVRRGVVILRLSQAEMAHPVFDPESLEYSPEFQAKLQYLDLSMAVITKPSLKMLLSKCRQLKKLSLEHVKLNDEICDEISKNVNLEALNLAMCEGIEPWSVKKMMTELKELHSLNISWATLSVESVNALVDNVTNNLLRLNIAGCRKSMFDSHIASLAKSCPQLMELDLSDCTALTSAVIGVICQFKDLEYLSLSRCYSISAASYMELRNLKYLTFLDVFGLLTDSALEMLQEAFADIGINKFIHSSVARPTVGTRRTSIWGLRTRD